MNPVEIPRHIEDPVHLLLWTIDEIAPIGIGLVIGIFLGAPLMYMGIGWGCSFFYKKFMDRHADGYILHVLYWYGLMPTRSKFSPNPFIKEFYP